MKKLKTQLNDFPHDERMITDDDFFEAMDFSWSGLDQVAKAYRGKDIAEARRATVEYFRTRKRPVWSWDLRGASPEMVIRKMVGSEEKLKRVIWSADAMLNNHFYVLNDNFDYINAEIDLGPKLNWHISELQEHNDLAEWFKRGRFFECLAIAFLVKKEVSYIKKYVEVLDKYLCEWPLVWEHKEPTAYFVQTFPVQDCFTTAYRVSLWIRLLYTDIPYDEQVPNDLTFRMIRSIWFAAWQYRRFDTDSFRPEYGHYLSERGAFPFRFALMLPEFPELRPMLQRGRQVIAQCVAHNFFEDGGCFQHSMSYTLAVLKYYMVYLSQLTGANKTYFLRGKAQKRVRRCFDMMASLVMPNGHFPDIGDDGGHSAQELLELGRDLYGSVACNRALKALKIVPGKVNGQNRLLPKAVCYSDGGYIAGRDGSSPQSNYFVLSTNTRGVMAHAHQDMLSLILHAKGETVIGEPAACLYQLTNTKEYQGSALRGYVYNMTSHNTVLAYGKPIQEDIFFSVNYGGYPPKVKILDFQPKKNYLYVSATHDGYTCCRHLRHILFVHKHGWLILDRILQGPATNPPQVLPHIQRWHFDAGVKVEQVDSHAVLARKGNAQLLCIWPKTGTRKINMELRKNTTIQVGPFREEEKLPWMVDASFEKTNQAWLPCVFLPIEEGVSKQLVEICRERIFTEVFKRAIDPVKDTAAILTLTKE